VANGESQKHSPVMNKLINTVAFCKPCLNVVRRMQESRNHIKQSDEQSDVQCKDE